MSCNVTHRLSCLRQLKAGPFGDAEPSHAEHAEPCPIKNQISPVSPQQQLL